MRNKIMKYSMILLLLFILNAGCLEIQVSSDQIDNPEDNPMEQSNPVITLQEMKRIDLYTQVLESAYAEENGGAKFIAVKADSLQGLSPEGKQLVLDRLKTISDNVYDYEDVKDNPSFFLFDANGNKRGTRDGTLLFLSNITYDENSATLTGVSWFGNLGAVFPEYEAHYINNMWVLTLLSMAVS